MLNYKVIILQKVETIYFEYYPALPVYTDICSDAVTVGTIHHLVCMPVVELSSPRLAGELTLPCY